MNIAKFPPTARVGLLCVLAATAASGLNNFLTKIAVTEVKDAVVFTSLKNGMVAVILLAILLAAGQWRGLLTAFKRRPLAILTVGVLGGGIPFALYFTGLTQTSAMNAALIHKTMVLWIALLALPLLKERLPMKVYVGIAALFAGNLLIGGFTGFKFNAGELMILGATALWAVENIVAKKVLSDVPFLTLAAVRMSVGCLVLFPLALSHGDIAAASRMSASGWGWTLLTAGLLTVYVLGWFAGLSRLPATVTAALLVPATLVTNVLSAVFVTHSWTGIQTAALAVTVLGATLVLMASRMRLPESSAASS